MQGCRDEGRACLIRILFFNLYLPYTFLCILLQINTSVLYYSQLLISTVSVNEDNNVVIIMTAVDAGFRLI